MNERLKKVVKIVVKRLKSKGYYSRSFSSIEGAAKFYIRPGVLGHVATISGISLKEKCILCSKVAALWRKV